MTAGKRGHGEKQSRAQDTAVAALLANPSIPAAAAAANLSERTLHRWLRQSSFQSAYREAKRQAVGQAIAQVQGGLSEAVQTLRAVMRDQASPSASRVAAARTMLDLGLKAVELEELEQRIERLEAQVAKSGRR